MTTTLKLSPALESQLAAEARARRISKSQVIRELLEKHYKNNPPKKRRTFGQLASHLIGVADGPKDLSTNPRYMKGYGG